MLLVVGLVSLSFAAYRVWPHANDYTPNCVAMCFRCIYHL
jgi:hypothetical protein